MPELVWKMIESIYLTRNERIVTHSFFIVCSNDTSCHYFINIIGISHLGWSGDVSHVDRFFWMFK
jgi:hypothetical protein